MYSAKIHPKNPCVLAICYIFPCVSTIASVSSLGAFKPKKGQLRSPQIPKGNRRCFCWGANDVSYFPFDELVEALVLALSCFACKDSATAGDPVHQVLCVVYLVPRTWWSCFGPSILGLQPMIKQCKWCKCMVHLRDSPSNSALIELVI